MTTSTATVPTEAVPATAAASPVRTLGIVSLALGAAAIVSGFQWVLGIAAIVIGILALQREPASKGLAITGIVLGALPITGFGFAAIGFLALLPFVPFLMAL